MLINHCHVSPRGFGVERDDPEMGTLPALQRVLSEAGVDRAVVFAPFGWGAFGGVVRPNLSFASLLHPGRLGKRQGHVPRRILLLTKSFEIGQQPVVYHLSLSEG